jgi:hypothetical protein
MLVMIYGRVFSRDQSTLVRSVASVGVLFVLLLFFYFMNWIPPVPLSLKFGGMYYQVRKEGTVYHLSLSKPSWYQLWKTSEDPVYFRPGQRVYCFTSVFAPADLKTQIFHHWQYYDQEQEHWVKKDRIGYSLTGGREGGYRGYTYKQTITPGEWRVDVETADEQLLGRIDFLIVEGKKDSLELKTIQR